MKWIIKSRDEVTGGFIESHYTTEDDFLAALKDLFGDPKQRFISATLPDGKALDEAAAKILAGGFSIGGGAIGETPV
jgi:hypothetical protein